ncbi:hypothetical protein IVB22_10755 [Bradyrhizobium sp. 190]|uniref:hypothetical protein n=1 Tax=Bradyrhizobium sp. 190 TaxID=2782658 RepID=UPI001FF7BA3B|nr:hypothetical protein [Bradyrhizobium sp. 190]MCK1513044.1 hypothetical protein [Bradyrhizobium sp. 190]
MTKLEDIDDELADAESDLDDIQEKILFLERQVPGLRARLADATSPQEKARLEDLLRKNEEERDKLRREEQRVEARADELGKEFREEQKLKPKKPKPKL